MSEKKPLMKRLGTLMFNKRFTMVFSIVMAFVLWLVIEIEQNPVRDQTFNDLPVTVSVENTAVSELGLGIVSDISSQKFSVVLRGPNYIVSSLKPEDILLSASVTDVNGVGTYSLAVNGTRNSSKDGYEFIAVTPATIDVTFDYIDTKEFTVTPKLAGVAAADGLVAENPVISDAGSSTLTIKGPRTLMDKITDVAAYAEVNEKLSATQTFDAAIVLYSGEDTVLYRYEADGKAYDADGKPVESNNLTLGFTAVKVTAPISKRATVKIRPQFSNLPAGLSAGSVKWTVDHPTVSVIGQPEVVSKMTELTLSAIDFTSVSTGSKRFKVPAVLPDGIKLLDNIETFVVTIDTSGYAEKTFDISTVKYVGQGDGLTARTKRALRNVKVCGPAAVISKLKASDLYAAVDVTEKPVGEHTINAVIRSDAYKNVWQVGVYPVTVQIS